VCFHPSVNDRLDTFDGGQGYANIMQHNPLQISKVLEHSLNHPKIPNVSINIMWGRRKMKVSNDNFSS
jgi:hypothetical protein